ncbi:GAF and ANTAR domain-containing protein [Amycolatopsis tucumanensis]|uniref:GAF and ANTAR domain-containing protein n=1 Tax=Amycolatopsis tucumanensis TaxID=401106 RepID=A0ABP7HET5_9PSEU|nr:GAF and ANTAR domain-containing protein [Amycolatopsis tucumanensis]MCF6423790.1 GAF and ANTAR domain-containing protein [Amycolatopsis tucumanensis]
MDETVGPPAAGRAAMGRDELADTVAKAVRELEPEPDVDGTVGHIVAAAMATIAGVEDAGVSLLESGQVRSVAPSSAIVAELDRLQVELGEGPCVDAMVDCPVYRVGDLAADRRWPRFAPAAAGRGMRSLLGVRLFTSSHLVGALNLYSHHRAAFDPPAERLVELFAAHAAVALAGSQRQVRLQAALDSRDVISTAKGMLMQRFDLSPEQAFDALVRTSQQRNTTPQRVAQAILTTHQPAAAPGPPQPPS